MSLLRKTYILTLLFGCFLSCSSSSAASASFSTPAQITGALAADSSLGNTITAVYAPVNGVVVATWLDSNDLPTYSLWDGSNWSAAASIPGTNMALLENPITLTCIPPSTASATPETVLATWIDNSGPSAGKIFYSAWNGSSWTTPATFFSATEFVTIEISSIVSAVYDTSQNQVVLAWLDNDIGGENSGVPFSATYTSSTESWSTPAAIDNATPPAGASTAVCLVYDETNNTVLAAWAANTSTALVYSVWSGSTWTTLDNISGGISRLPPTLTYNPANKTVLATWIEASSSPAFKPSFSFWSSTTYTWTTAVPITGTMAANSVTTTNTYNAISKTILTMWQDSSSLTPTYSIWNDNTWSSNPQAITGATGANSVHAITATYNTVKGTILATWLDNNSSYPIYSVWNGTSWSPNAGPIPRAAGGISNIPTTSVYNTNTGTTLVLWISSGSHIPTYSVYTQR